MTESTDLVLFTAAAAFASGLGTSIPAGDKYILLLSEQVTVGTLVAQYNAGIASAVANLQAMTADVAMVDIYSIVADAAGLDGTTGIVVDGVTLSPDFAPNGIYSSDGVHFNPRGNALIANKIIAAMNARWGAGGTDIPEIDVLAQRGVIFQ
jgi:lysophospholipase L1-like esterase